MKNFSIIFFLLFFNVFLSGIGFDKNLLVGKKEVKQENLKKYLSGSAEYCSRLKSEAFHFFCKEKILMDFNNLNLNMLSSRSGLRKIKFSEWQRYNKKYLFDYQLISNNGRVTEQRRAINEHERNKGPEATELLLSFLSERAVFGPGTILLKEAQKKFVFKILRMEKIVDRDCVVIGVTPLKNNKIFFSSGKVFLDSENFSIRKIIVNPSYIKGYKNLKKISGILKSRLFLKCTVNYNKEHNGLYFPTEVTITETYKGGKFVVQNMGYTGWERSRTSFKYMGYKFFKVDLEVYNKESQGKKVIKNGE